MIIIIILFDNKSAFGHSEYLPVEFHTDLFLCLSLFLFLLLQRPLLLLPELPTALLCRVFGVAIISGSCLIIRQVTITLRLLILIEQDSLTGVCVCVCVREREAGRQAGWQAER